MSGDLSTCPQDVDLLIVGAGLSGAVLAERCSRELNMTSVVVDKRDHIGGNCYDYVSPDGIRCSKYGAHLFHTQFERVWEYVRPQGQRAGRGRRRCRAVGAHTPDAGDGEHAV